MTCAGHSVRGAESRKFRAVNVFCLTRGFHTGLLESLLLLFLSFDGYFSAILLHAGRSVSVGQEDRGEARTRSSLQLLVAPLGAYREKRAARYLKLHEGIICGFSSSMHFLSLCITYIRLTMNVMGGFVLRLLPSYIMC